MYHRPITVESLENRNLLTTVVAFSLVDQLAGSLNFEDDGSMELTLQGAAEDLSFELTRTDTEIAVATASPGLNINIDTDEVVDVEVETPDTSLAVQIEEVVGPTVAVQVDDADQDFDFLGDLTQTDFEVSQNHNGDVLAVDALFTDLALAMDFAGSNVDINLAAQFVPPDELSVDLATVDVNNSQVNLELTPDDYEVDVTTDEGQLELQVDTILETFSGAFVFDDLSLLLLHS